MVMLMNYNQGIKITCLLQQIYCLEAIILIIVLREAEVDII